MGGGRRQAAPESIGVCSAADDGDVKQVLLEVYRVSTPTAASPARMGVSSRTRLLWSVKHPSSHSLLVLYSNFIAVEWEKEALAESASSGRLQGCAVVLWAAKVR